MDIEFKNILIQNDQWTADVFTNTGVFICTINLELDSVTDELLQQIKDNLLGQLNG